MGSQRSWQRLDLRCKQRGRYLIIFLFLALPLSATTYYVDNCVVGGNDSNNGTSTSTPWLTIAHVNAQSFNPGDSILFQGGCVWREALAISPSGSTGRSAGSGITVGSYGSGQPIIDGSDIYSSGWTNTSGNIWQHALNPPYAAHIWVFFNGVAGGPNGGNPMASRGAIVSSNQWFWDGTSTLYVFSTSNPATAFTSPGIEVTTRVGVQASNQSYVTFNNLNVRKTSQSCFDLYQLSHGTVSNTTTAYCGKNNIVFYNSTPGLSDNCVIANNIGTYASESGIAIKDTNNCVAYGNNISHAGIQLDDEDNIGIVGNSGSNYIYNNYAHDSTDQTGSIGIRCFELDTITSPKINYLYDNFAARCNGTGIIVEHSANQQVYYNISIDNAHGVGGDCCVAGFKDSVGNSNIYYGNTTYNNEFTEMEVTSNTTSGPIIKNNIFYASSGGQGAVFTNGATGTSPVMDYNLVFGNSVAYNWSGTSYATPALFYAASGQCQHDLNSDPKFTNAAASNFSLQSGSPAIDTGTNLGSTYQFGLAPGSSWPSAVSTLNQNGGGAGWEIGAFVFVQTIPSPAAPTGLSATVN